MGRRGWVDGRPPVPPAAARNAAKTECDHGHKLAGGNLYLYVDPRGAAHRYCRRCRLDAQRRRRIAGRAPRTRPNSNGVG